MLECEQAQESCCISHRFPFSGNTHPNLLHLSMVVSCFFGPRHLMEIGFIRCTSFGIFRFASFMRLLPFSSHAAAQMYCFCTATRVSDRPRVPRSYCFVLAFSCVVDFPASCQLHSRYCQPLPPASCELGPSEQ